jgi:excisionase family DNA binding protein
VTGPLRVVPQELLTTREVADYLRVHPSSVYRLRRDHGLPSVCYGRRMRRFRLDDVRRWQSEQEETAA